MSDFQKQAQQSHRPKYEYPTRATKQHTTLVYVCIHNQTSMRYTANIMYTMKRVKLANNSSLFQLTI